MKTRTEGVDAERERVAEELRRIREAVRDRALEPRNPREALPPPKAPRDPEAPALGQLHEPAPLPSPPDAAIINTLWEVREPSLPRGLRGYLARLLVRLLSPVLNAQAAFNSKQVQLDNEILAYLGTRFTETHRHYDRVLGIHSKHMEEIDERHLILQEELVSHVHDLVRRIDLVFSEAERGRVSLESVLRDVRARLARLEEAGRSRQG